jgi:acyl-CoA dehydrogenase
VAAHAQRRADDEPVRWGRGEENFGLFKEQSPEQELAGVTAAKQWQRLIFEAGYGWITGPPEYGGGLDRAYERAWTGVLAGYDTPALTPQRMGTQMIGPTILEYGSDEARAALLRGIYRADAVCCQLFSEPEAGSDLAGLKTTARRDCDTWTITGQKVWTSHAHYADVAEIICRTDPEAPKHRGLSAFVVDMHAPGVEVRPLRQMTGGASFNEVFLDEAQVPDAYRLGPVNGGWSVALYTLAGADLDRLRRRCPGSWPRPARTDAGPLRGAGRPGDPRAVRQALRRLAVRALDGPADGGRRCGERVLGAGQARPDP